MDRPNGMFLLLQGTQWWKVLGEIEVLSLIMACLCHDLDHRGTNNSFQVKYVASKSVFLRKNCH